MPNTQYRNYPYPAYKKKPYFSDIRNTFNAIDLDVKNAWDIINELNKASGVTERDIIHFGQTTNGTETELFVDGVSERFITTIDTAYNLTTSIIAKCISGESEDGLKSWKIETTINNKNNTLSIVGTQIKTILALSSESNEDSWDVNVSISGTNIIIKVIGFSGEIINWQCVTSGPIV